MSYSVDDTSISTETYTETISSGETIQFTFGQTYDFSELGDYNLSISASLSEDENQNNNTISEVITNVGGGDCPDQYSLPIVWRENFECYDPFIFENIGDWVIYDLDQLATYGANAMDFSNETYTGAGLFIIKQLQPRQVKVRLKNHGGIPMKVIKDYILYLEFRREMSHRIMIG